MVDICGYIRDIVAKKYVSFHVLLYHSEYDSFHDKDNIALCLLLDFITYCLLLMKLFADFKHLK